MLTPGAPPTTARATLGPPPYIGVASMLAFGRVRRETSRGNVGLPRIILLFFIDN
jgi:hypothetical protein